MHLLAAAVAVLLFHTPAQWEAWSDDWHQRASIEVTQELMDEWRDMRDRHPCHVHPCTSSPTRPQNQASTSARGSSGMGNGGSDVERWRPLVAEYFPAERIDKALAVMRCESGGNPDAKNRRSSAAGLFQFLRDTWNRTAQPLGYGSYDSGAVYDPRANIHAASVLSKQGSNWGPWSCG